MNSSKKGFMLYCDLLFTVKKLPDETAGKLFKSILQYVNNEEVIIEDLLLDVVFEPIKNQINRDLSKWETIVEKRSNAGKASGKSRKGTHVKCVEQKGTHVRSVQQSGTKRTDIVTDTVKEIKDNKSFNINIKRSTEVENKISDLNSKESLPEIKLDEKTDKRGKKKKEVIHVSAGQKFKGTEIAEKEMAVLGELIDNSGNYSEAELREMDKGVTYSPQVFMAKYPKKATDEAVIIAEWEKLVWYIKEFIVEHCIEAYLSSLDKRNFAVSPEEFLQTKVYANKKFGNNKHFPKEEWRYDNDWETLAQLFHPDGYPKFKYVYANSR